MISVNVTLNIQELAVIINSDFVGEFLETGARPKSKHSMYRPPQTFRMDNILQHMQGFQEHKEEEM